MNITLIFPLLSKRRAMIDENKQYWPPLGLAYVAAVLEEAGHNIQIIDRDIILRKNKMNFDKMDNLMLEEVRGFRPDLIGISATTPIMSDADYVARYLKEVYKDVRIIVGGPHPTAEPILTLTANPFIDAVVIGEGELTVRDIADGVTFDKIKGLVYRSDGRIVSNPERPPAQNIDEFPFPARHLLDMKFYTRPSRFIGRNLSVKTTSIFTARGCPYRCNFCSGPRIFSGKVRFHSPARVINEMEELISKYSIEALYFAEDMFLSSKNRAEELLNLFIERGINKKIKWMAQAKASIITEELLTLMKEAGCVGIEYGFESGSQRVLDLMNKNLKVEDSIRAAELTRKMGIRFQANMIAGYPGEREEDFEKSIGLIRKISPNMTALNIFMALPGTPSYEKLKSEGKKLPRWDDLGDPETTQNNFADMPKAIFDKLYFETRLKVILPMNLRSFVIDNLNNPVRLLRVALTQFKGVLVKTLRSILKLIFLNKGIETPKKTNVLFISYNGLLEPILPSQGIPYLKGLAKNDYNFVLLTYEKKSDLKRVGRDGLKKLKGELKADNVEWRYLTYHKNPRSLATLFDLFVGMVQAFYIIIVRRIRIVHIRGITPGIMMIALSGILNVKILFDMRGLLAEEYVGGGLWKENGLPFRLIKTAEKHMLETADAVSVLTKKHYDLNRAQDYLRNRNIAMSVIPCCVDMNRFYYDEEKEIKFKKELGLENKFVLMYPGKMGTFYLMDEMIAFYKAMLNLLPNSIFFILTNDPPERVVEKAHEMGLDRDKMRILNNVRFADMPRYLRIADAGIFFINPYKKFGSSPIKLGEFLASGVPVVINPGVGDTEEIVKNNKVGVIVTEFSDSCYKSSAHELIELIKEGPEDLKKRCRDTAGRYLSLEDGINKYLTLYRSLS